MRVDFCILDVIHNTGEWKVYLDSSGYASTKSCRWKRILCTGVQSRAYSKQWARESLKAGATHQPNPRWKGVLSTWWVQSKARQMAGLLKGVGKRVDCPQSLFYFVPQEISQPSRIGYKSGRNWEVEHLLLQRHKNQDRLGNTSLHLSATLGRARERERLSYLSWNTIWQIQIPKDENRSQLSNE